MNGNNYKLICTDVDGTLVDRDGKLPENSRMVLKKAIDMGIKVAIVSGRFRRGVDTIVKQLDLPVWSACFNGLYIEAGRDNIVYSNTTPKEGMSKVLQIARKYGQCTHLFGLDDWYAEEKEYFYNRMFQVMVSGGDHIQNLQEVLDSDAVIYKLLVKDKDTDRLKNTKQIIENSNICGIKCLFSSPNILEILPKDADKSKAVEEYCKYLNINKSQVMALGDYDNDAGMLKAAGTAIAMGNCTPLCRESATFVTKTLEDDGFSYALEKFLNL